MPAAAVIPAPIAYIKVVVVKKLVVGCVSRGVGSPLDGGVNWRVSEMSCRWRFGLVASGARFGYQDRPFGRPSAPGLTARCVLSRCWSLGFTLRQCRGGPARLL